MSVLYFPSKTLQGMLDSTEIT